MTYEILNTPMQDDLMSGATMEEIVWAAYMAGIDPTMDDSNYEAYLQLLREAARNRFGI